MNVLVIAEHDNQVLKSSTFATISAARLLGETIDILIAGAGCESVVKSAAAIDGINKVLYADDPAYANALAENITPLVVNCASHYSHLLTPASTTGKNFMPRVAARLDIAQISDVIAIESKDTFVRPIYAGNALATVTSCDAIKALTIRSTAFDSASPHGGSADIEKIEATEATTKSHFVKEELSQSERPELDSAEVIVSGGRALGSRENFLLLEPLADKLNAAIGASRAAVDAGYVSNDYQVGQTGKIVAPQLYFAIGISGAIQHLAGMKDSKIIVAINKDEDAPIFQVADYGLVADLFDVLPSLIDTLSK